jgi:hypothetical protein
VKAIFALLPASPAASPAIEASQGRMQESVARAEAAFATLEQFDPGVELAELAGRLAQAYVFVGEQEKARVKADLAIELSESLGASYALARAFTAMAIVVDGTPAGGGDCALQAVPRDLAGVRPLRDRIQRSLQPFGCLLPAVTGTTTR